MTALGVNMVYEIDEYDILAWCDVQHCSLSQSITCSLVTRTSHLGTKSDSMHLKGQSFSPIFIRVICIAVDMDIDVLVQLLFHKVAQPGLHNCLSPKATQITQFVYQIPFHVVLQVYFVYTSN